MNLRDLNYFTEIVELGSISEAARRNYIAQQSMSGHLKKLEDYYQTTLIRRGNPMSLTDSGIRLYRTAKQVLALLDQVQAEISADRSRQKKKLTLGLSFSGIPPFLEELLERIQQQEGAELEVQIRNDCARLMPLPEEIELYLGLEPPGWDFDEIPLLSDQMAVAVSKSLLEQVHGADAERAAAAVRETSDPAALNPVPFVHVRSPALNETLYRGLQTMLLETSSDALGASLCRDGKGALITMEDYARRMFRKDAHILVIPLPEGKVVRLSLYCRKGRELSPAAARFIQAAKAVLA